MNFFDHKGLGNHLLQLCLKVVKHPVYIYISQWNAVTKVSLLAYPRSLLFWRRLIVGYCFIGQTYRSYLQGPNSQSSLACAIYISLSACINCQNHELLYLFKTGQHNGHGEDLLAFFRMYIPYVIKMFVRTKIVLIRIVDKTKYTFCT